jgi:phage terminase small subunit
MGRNGQPSDLIQMNGRSHHLTKEEVERRKAAEIKVTNKSFKASDSVMKDERALKEFKKLKKLYKDIEFVSALDEHIINQYCLSVSELDDMVEISSRIRENLKGSMADDTAKVLEMFTNLDVSIRLKRQEIIKLSDRLYLNPVARTKNVPSAKKEAPKNKFSKFAGGASG